MLQSTTYPFPTATRAVASMLAEPLRTRLSEYYWRIAFEESECLVGDSDHGPKGTDPPIIPHAPVRSRSCVFRGDEYEGSYNHHNQVAKFRGQYYYAWSNGVRNEEDAAQRVLIATSADARSWSSPWLAVDTGLDETWAANCVGLGCDGDRLHLICMVEETLHDETAIGMRRIRPESALIKVYSSEDGHGFEEVAAFDPEIKWIFEMPRLTCEGRLLCICATHHGPAVLLWPGNDVTVAPEVIDVPEPPGAVFPYGESSWYQLDSGEIIVFWRDEGASCYLYANHSLDGGNTWSAPVLTDIPDSMSRVFAGRFPDGRYYLVGNSVPRLLDRRHLLILVGDSGLEFNEAWVIDDSNSRMRHKGLLKANGSQYPCCLQDGSDLLVAYDHNKEDIWCAVVDTTALKARST